VGTLVIAAGLIVVLALWACLALLRGVVALALLVFRLGRS
jgi:hypothetical protein